MEPHELAIAALSQVARNANHRERTECGSGTTCESSENTSNAPQRRAKINNLGSQSGDGSGQVGQGNVGTHTQSTTSKPLCTIDITAPAAAPASESPLSKEMIASGYQSQLSRPTDVAPFESAINEIGTPPTAGQKRSADGHVKSESASPIYPHLRQHSRNVSSVSNASTASSIKIGELTSELRTRLSYAMIKVKKGWQSNSIDEVENLASQRGSPTSSVSTMHVRQNILTSPRIAIAQEQAKLRDLRGASAEFDPYGRSEQASRTYESFWRDHTVPDTSVHRPLTHGVVQSSPPPRVLAPPADIQPTSSFPRQSSTPTKYIRPQTRRDQCSTIPPPGTVPQTPRRIGPQEVAVMKPPPKTTVQEQDAIETLLFMSSPGNVGSSMKPALPPPRSQNSPQGSPLRTELYPPARRPLGRRVDNELTPNQSKNTGRIERRLPKRPKPAHQDVQKSATINRLLDEMGESTSDEEELIINYSTPPRVAAHRI